MPFSVLDPTTAAAAPVTTAGAPLTSTGETLASISAEVLSCLYGRTDVDSTRVTKWVNWGYRNICGMLDLTELKASIPLSLVASQPFYLVPKVVAWINRITLVDTTDFSSGGAELELIDEPLYRQLPDVDSTAQAVPESYFRYGRMVVVWPTPVTSYTAAMDCRIRPVNMTSPTHSPILPEEFHQAIMQAGLENAWRALQVPAKAATAANDKLTILRPLLDTDAEERSNMQARMVPVRSRSQLFSKRGT